MCIRDRLLGARVEQPPEAVLVEDRDAELDGLVVLGSGRIAGHDVRRFLRHRAGGLAAADQDRLLGLITGCLLYTSPSPRDRTRSRMPSSA